MREEIEKYINENYDILQEYPWNEYPNYTTFKHKNNKKWFALIMDVPYEKLSINKDGMVNIINLKNIPEMLGGLRKDGYFIQDDLWYKQNDKYEKFLDENKDKSVLLLEFGVGFNTPGIIRFPFEQMTSQNKNWKLIRFNKEDMTFYDLENRFIRINEDINTFFRD